MLGVAGADAVRGAVNAREDLWFQIPGADGSPISTGLDGSALHCDQEPGNRLASRPAAVSAATAIAAVTPEPQ